MATDWYHGSLDSAFDALDRIQELIHIDNEKWWRDLETGEPIERNVGELIALEHSELSEALEGARKNKMDDHLPNYHSEEVELADAMIRILDHAEGRSLDVVGAMRAKLEYNRHRADHKAEARRAAGGKKF